MNRNERHKAIANAVATAVANPLAPAWVKVGLAAMAEELRELDARVRELELETTTKGAVNAEKTG